ncbi:putative transposase IS66 [Photobacterium gaetbulicola Gung47]|uniref:Putative transposase IS66 n=1 Tax=Photobacterium gaetbulicola Gung47 TaxID=658445 RepID=A0A0C5WGF5_9GAMM|nr:putative transposase IS66 [Photobacterium gaetbulicola Gung47]
MLHKHYEGLTAFFRIEGAQLDNKRTEQSLKLVARNRTRKNVMFHKTQAGAGIADVVMSIIATSAEKQASKCWITLIHCSGYKAKSGLPSNGYSPGTTNLISD